jgi:hypothetical protein
MSNYQKCYVFLIIAYAFFSTKLEKRAEQVLPGGRGREWRTAGGEMAQTMYARMNKKKTQIYPGRYFFHVGLFFIFLEVV